MDNATTPKNVLSAIGTLAGANNLIVLGLQIGNELVPLVKGAITEIRQISTKSETVTYQLLITTDGAELDAVDKLSADDLDAINAELVKAGAKPLPTA